MKISILVEGRTERAFVPYLREFLKPRLSGRMPNIDPFPYDGRIPKEEKLRKAVEGLLRIGRPPSDAVIALTDVYTGTDDFADAADAKRKMREWVGKNPRFHPHAAQHDFEASLEAVPAWVCGQCGEPYFEAPEVKVIQRLLLQLDRQTANLASVA